MRPSFRLAGMLTALAAAGALPSAARAQFSLSTLPSLLQTAAVNDLGASRAAEGVTVARVLSFGATSFRFAAQPPLRYELVGGYAFYVAACTGDDGSGSSQEEEAAREAAKREIGGDGGAGPPSGSSSRLPPNLYPVTQFLPPGPPLPANYDLTMEIDRPLDGLSFLPARGMAADTLTAAWAVAAVEGRSKQALAPIVPSGRPPMLGDGVIVLAVTPFLHLKDQAYGVTAGVSSYAARTPAGEAIFTATTPGAYGVTGHFSSGRWTQGSGLLFVPARQRIASKCRGGVAVTPLGPDILASLGVAPGKPFEMNAAGLTFVRTTSGPR